MNLRHAAIGKPMRFAMARIISARDADERQLSAQTLRGARERAAALEDQAKEAAKQLRESAKKLGQLDGLKQYQSALFALEAERSALREAISSEAITHVFAVINQLLPSIPKDIVTESMVRETLKRVRGTHAIELRVNPAQMASAQSVLNACISEMSVPVIVKADATLTEDECVVMGETGSLKASLNEQLTALEQNVRANLCAASGA
jgi:flagellar biosynthesis/type III secretory pathway protein FliH